MPFYAVRGQLWNDVAVVVWSDRAKMVRLGRRTLQLKRGGISLERRAKMERPRDRYGTPRGRR